MSEFLRLIPAGTIIFAGCYPEHVEDAKKYAKDNGFKKGDIKIAAVTQKHEYKGKTYEHKAVIIKALKPIYVECAIQKQES